MKDFSRDADFWIGNKKVLGGTLDSGLELVNVSGKLDVKNTGARDNEMRISTMSNFLSSSTLNGILESQIVRQENRH